MWSDHEAEIDFLGFDVLIATLNVLVSDQSLRPVTIGIDGTWGSGKSSLMTMAANELKDSEDGLTPVLFSPWMFEDYDNIKFALIGAILDSVLEQTHDSGTTAKVHAARRIMRGLSRFRGTVTTATSIGAGAAAAALGQPEAAAPAAAIAAATAEEALSHVPQEEPEPAEPDDVYSVASLRRSLAEALDSLPGDLHFVAFVDDVDRCLPDTVVGTFEVMRLFSDIPQVTFVLAADREIVESAITARYKSLGFDTEARSVEDREPRPIGRDYLEKMWNVTVKIPPLTGPEVETYLTLLSCQRHHSNDLPSLHARAKERRRAFETLTTKDLGEIIDEPSDAFRADRSWITATADVIATLDDKHKGNPRQIKRFANRIALRMRLLSDPDLGLGDAVQSGVLVKLMLLAEQSAEDFNALLRATLATHNGTVEEFSIWEGQHAPPDDARDEDDSEADEGHTAAEAALDTYTDGFRRWLTLEPSLVGVDLRPYFHVTSEQRRPVRHAGDLSLAAREVYDAFSAPIHSDTHKQAVEAFFGLAEGDRAVIIRSLERVVPRQPAAGTTDALLAIAKKNPHYVSEAVRALRSIPADRVKPALVPKAVAALGDFNESLAPLLEQWGTQDGAHPLMPRVVDREVAKLNEEG